MSVLEMDSHYERLIDIIRGIDGTEESLNKAEKQIEVLESEVNNEFKSN